MKRIAPPVSSFRPLRTHGVDPRRSHGNRAPKARRGRSGPRARGRVRCARRAHARRRHARPPRRRCTPPPRPQAPSRASSSPPPARSPSARHGRLPGLAQAQATSYPCSCGVLPPLVGATWCPRLHKAPRVRRISSGRRDPQLLTIPPLLVRRRLRAARRWRLAWATRVADRRTRRPQIAQTRLRWVCTRWPDPVSPTRASPRGRGRGVDP